MSTSLVKTVELHCWPELHVHTVVSLSDDLNLRLSTLSWPWVQWHWFDVSEQNRRPRCWPTWVPDEVRPRKPSCLSANTPVKLVSPSITGIQHQHSHVFYIIIHFPSKLFCAAERTKSQILSRQYFVHAFTFSHRRCTLIHFWWPTCTFLICPCHFSLSV